MQRKAKPLVSIIIPVYNAHAFLKDTIKTIKEQTYDNWEAIFIDDKSKDESLKILKEASSNDKRIKVLESKKNSGAASARNRGIKISKGEFLCFLDADDLWKKTKLEEQLDFMKKSNCAFSFTGYEFADSTGKPNGKKVYIPKKMNYKQALKNTTICTITVMFDMNKLTKDDIYMPIVKSEDTATWWKVLKKIDYAYGLNEILSYYRRGITSASSNKITAIKQIWDLYRNVEHLNMYETIYNFIGYAFNAVKRRI